MLGGRLNIPPVLPAQPSLNARPGTTRDMYEYALVSMGNHALLLSCCAFEQKQSGKQVWRRFANICVLTRDSVSDFRCFRSIAQCLQSYFQTERCEPRATGDQLVYALMNVLTQVLDKTILKRPEILIIFERSCLPLPRKAAESLSPFNPGGNAHGVVARQLAGSL